MKTNVPLTIASLLSILLMTFHMMGDIMRDQGGMASYYFVTVPVLAVWLYGTIVLPERRSGLIIMLVGSILGAGAATIHMTGAGSELAKTHGEFWVWLILAQGVTGLFSFILAARGLWSLRGAPRGQS
jgi:hypothetical protein